MSMFITCTHCGQAIFRDASGVIHHLVEKTNTADWRKDRNHLPVAV